jgi:hypothetical protein
MNTHATKPRKRIATKARNHETSLDSSCFRVFVARCFRVFVALFSLVVCASTALAGDRYALIVTGASGGPQYAEKYTTWRTAFVTLLRERFAYPADHVVALAEDEAGLKPPTRETVRAAFDDLRRRVGKEDVLLVLLIGHGTSEGDEAKFNLVGPDLSAAEWAALVKPIPGRLVFVNATAGSFPFLERLSGRGRVVLTANDSAAQQFDTVFPEFFVHAFDDEAADLDKNGKVSILEAFRYASGRVKEWFAGQGRLATERPLIDDTGDGIGREADAAGPDGALAQVTYLQPDAPIITTTDTELAALLRRRAEVETALEVLRARKAAVPPEQYENELETLLLELARLDQKIRAKS